VKELMNQYLGKVEKELSEVALEPFPRTLFLPACTFSRPLPRRCLHLK
jgi:hypothetical protein